MTKPISENYTQTTYDSDNATRKLNVESTIEIGDEFVKILQDNAFNGIDGTGVVNHIAKVLEILEWIKIPNVDKDQLRTEGSISNADEYDKPCNKSQKNSCLDSFFKPYLDAQEGNRIYNFEESNQYPPPTPAPIEYDVNNPDEDAIRRFSTWMAFGGNTRNLGLFGEETDEITDLHQILEEVLLTERGDSVASIK
ncbi:hypothetical protein Tco_0513781 [Tanacetum coccineum]